MPEAFCSAYFEMENLKQENFDSRRSVRNPNTERVESSIRLCFFGEIQAIVTTNEGPPFVVTSSQNKRIEVVYVVVTSTYYHYQYLFLDNFEFF